VQAESLDGAGNPTGIIWRFDAEEYPFDPPVGPVVTFPPTTQPVDTSQIQSPSFEPLLEYRYSMYETLSGDFVDEMPVTYSNYGKVLNAPGAGEIHLPIRAMKGSFAEALGRPFQEKMTSNSFEEYTHCIAIVRNDACVWSGFLGRTRVSSADRRVSIALIGYWDYFRNRLIRQRMDLAGQNAFTAVRQLIDHCQDEYGIASDLGVLTGSGLAPFFTDQVINTYDFRYYGDVIEDMAKSDDHFEFSIDTQFDTSELLTKTLKLGAPTLGRRVEYVLEWGKNMYVYNYERDGDQRRNQMWGVGAGEGDNLVIARAIDNPSLGRFPIRDGVIQRKSLDSTQRSSLQRLTDGEVKKYGGSVQILNCTIDATDAVGVFNPGDSVPVVIDDGFTQIDTWMRVLTTSVRVQDNLSESMDIDLGPEWATGG